MNNGDGDFFVYQVTRAYGAIAPEPLGCASHSYLTEESVTDKRTNHGRTKYGMATLFQIDQATFICRQWTN